jgi:hypothetical protein
MVLIILQREMKEMKDKTDRGRGNHGMLCNALSSYTNPEGRVG